MKTMKIVAVAAITAVCLGAMSADAKDGFKVNPKQVQVLSAVTAAELPAKAAQIVTQARKKDQKSVTMEVVTAAISVNSAATPSVVGAISRAVPEMAPVAAATAAALQSKWAAHIAKAAAVAAPDQAEKIVFAVCREVPNEYRSVTVGVAEAVPSAGKGILKGLVEAIPAYRPAVDQATPKLADIGGASYVTAVLDQARLNSPAQPGMFSPSPVTPANPQKPIIRSGGTGY